MNKNAVAAIVKKDTRAVLGSAQMWLPMIIVPLIFVVVYPLILLLAFKHGGDVMNNGSADALQKLIATLPPGELSAKIAAFPEVSQQMAFLFLNYLFIPLFMLIPVMAASIISANSFAGEKEKKTMETLLYAPISEGDLLLAKVLAAFLPAQAITVVSAVAYGALVDVVGYGFFGGAIFPSLHWLVAVFWLSPTVSLLAIFANVLLSAKVKGFQEAQQLSVIVILPLVALFIAELTGFLFLGTAASFLAGAGLLILDIILLRLAPKSFHRQKLFLTKL